MKFCPNCGYKLSEGSKFCPNCGYKITDDNKFEKVSGKHFKTNQIKTKKSKTKIKLNYSEIFSELFKHHTTKEAEEIFSWGVKRPTLEQIDVNLKCQFKLEKR